MGSVQSVVAREIDRITLTLRPARPIVGYQRWRDLLFLHWPIPVEVLRPLVPEPLSIDTYEGVAYVGLVPFWMIGVRPTWAPERSAFRFLETNVRTYTHLEGRDPSRSSATSAGVTCSSCTGRSRSRCCARWCPSRSRSIPTRAWRTSGWCRSG